MYDTILTDFPRLNGETNDSPRIQRAIDATDNGILCIPKGNYDICETIMINCDFFNNKLMGMKNLTAIKHVKGNLSVVSCRFRGTVGSEVLYEGTGEDVEWISNIAVGGENMKDDFLRKNTINLN